MGVTGEGDEPPQLSTTSPNWLVRKNGNRTKGKRRRPEKATEVSEVEVDVSPKILNAQWVPLADVENINMGTGILKVWNLAKKLWTIAQ